MALEFRKTYFLKVYTGEDVMVDDYPLYKAIIKEAIRLKLAGGTVLRGIGGYATTRRSLGRAVNTFISGNANNPIIVEIVDEKEDLEKILPFLEKHATHALVVMGEADYLVTDYMRKRWAEKDAGAGENKIPSFKLRQQEEARLEQQEQLSQQQQQ